MRNLSFKKFFEATDIFGFGKEKQNDEEKEDELDNEPLDIFDVEMMIEYLAKRKIGATPSSVKFMNEIHWGTRSGAVKLEVSPSQTFYVKKLGKDLQGNERWVTKKMFQLNRLGYGGYEDSVANEIYEVINDSAEGMDKPMKDWDGLENLVQKVAQQMRQVCKDIFIYEGIKKVSEDDFIIAFGVRGQGVQARDQMRVEQNCTELSYDSDLGTIRVTNYKVASPLSGHEWKIMPSDMDLWFFPSQDRDEISECVATFIKYY